MGSTIQCSVTAFAGMHSGQRLAHRAKQFRALLGFEAEVSLEEGLRRLVAWWHSREDHC